MKHLILFTLFFSIVFLISGQNSPVEVTYNFNPDYTVDFFYRKSLPGNYRLLSGKEYTSRISNEQIVKELSKKEQKKFGK